jgi:bifunctional lysine-specific demethylase and histidyl-hydroxylase NO66
MSKRVVIDDDQNMPTLGGLLTPFPVADFVASIWGREILRVSDRSRSYDSLIDPNGIDALLTTAAYTPGAVALIRDGSTVSPSQYQVSPPHFARSRAADPGAIREALADGWTALVNGVHRANKALRTVCAKLEWETGHPCQMNMYVSPPGGQGFATHTDDHDVLVLQLAGKKKWVLPGYNPGKGECLTASGDLLYIPRGRPHAARCSSDEMSVHITLGILAVTKFEVALESLREDGGFQTALPLGYHRMQSDMAANLASAITKAIASSCLERGLQRTIERLAASAPSCDTVLSDANSSTQWANGTRGDTSYYRCAGMFISSLRKDRDTIEVICCGQQVRLPASAEPFLRFALRTSGRFTLSEAPPVINHAVTETVARVLVACGFLTHEVCGPD